MFLCTRTTLHRWVALLRRFRSHKREVALLRWAQKLRLKQGNCGTVTFHDEKIKNKEVDLIRRYMLTRGMNMVLEPWSVTRS